jgi:hypothetical protein
MIFRKSGVYEKAWKIMEKPDKRENTLKFWLHKMGFACKIIRANYGSFQFTIHCPFFGDF